MDVKKIYEQKKSSAFNALQQIKTAHRIVMTGASGEPLHLIREMVDNKHLFNNIELVQLMPQSYSRFTDPEMQGHFRYNTPFVSPVTCKAVLSGNADFTPCFLSQIPRLFETTLPVDVALIHVSPPDEHGYCSFGINVDYIKPGAEKADIVIAQVNEYMPQTMGDCYIHINDINYVVEYSEPIPEIHVGKDDPAEQVIGQYCASLISDGDTLQLGVGGIPNAILGFLTGKKDLGIHSETISDGVMNLMKAGIITNKRKTIDRNVATVSFAMGTRELMSFMHKNPSINMMPADYVNNPIIIMQNDNFVSINSCIEVDLMGQVVSESIGRKQVSGVGGQVDFVRGASMAKNGKSIIAMPSTAAGGKLSRIVATITEGAAVTTSRNDVDYVITEYGIAELKGHTLRERADALINIAHPEFRNSLREQWEQLFSVAS